ncbi:MAG: response regulator, partial [Methylomarinum sp.]|nr:response regulator [Methylomarinum sp.]
GIQFRLLLLSIIPPLLVVSALAYYFIHSHFVDLENALKEKGRITTNQLAISSIYGVFSANSEVLNEITSALLRETDIVSIQIFDALGGTLAKSEQKPLPSTEELIFFQHSVTIHSFSKENKESIALLLEQGPSQTIKTIGSVRVALSLENTHKKQKTYLINSLLLIFMGITCSILITIWLSRTISRPIISLTKTANALANGNMNARANYCNTAEIGQLVQSFNSMAETVQQTQSHLLNQVDIAVSELNKTLIHLEDKNKSLEKTTQLAVSQNKTKSQFIAHISHEIRTPMNGILGFIELLTNSALSLQQLDQAQLIKTSATNLLTIVNEILDYSSLETGNFKVNISTFNFREIIENCASIITPISGNVQVIIDIDNTIPCHITSDPNRLQQIITNLLGNANKFTQQGHIILRCRKHTAHSLFISVSDTGIGIHQNKINNLFQPFKQLNEYTIDNKLGTGLGLTISKNIIQRLKGSIGVCSRYKTGSTFWINLPVKLSAPEATTLKHQYFIVVDSFELRRKAFVKQLVFLGYTVLDVPSLDQLNNQKVTPCDLLFYAKKDTSKLSESLSEKIRSFVIGPTIYITHSSLTKANCLSLPCRSSHLKSIIKNQLSPILDLPILTSQPPHKQRNTVSIFIADDNEINRLLLQSQLKDYCNNITLAIDGKSALTYLQKYKYDLILLDLQMPFYSGLELIKIIKQANALNHDSPVIAITAHAQSHQRKKLIKAGFDECLIKPILMDQLEEILSLWLPESNLKNTDTSINNNDYVPALLQRTSQNTVLALNIFNKLFTELPEQSLLIDQALKAHNLHLAQEITHKLHGSVSFCGFSDIQQLAYNLEVCFPENDSQLIQFNFEQLKNKIINFSKQKDLILQQLQS